MQTLTFYKKNTNFTYSNICQNLDKFWRSEINMFKQEKVWLTLCVVNTCNTHFIFIKNLPFNTGDFEDVLTVLNENYSSNTLRCSNDQIRKIIFSYRIVIKQKNIMLTKKMYLGLIAFLFLTSLLLILDIIGLNLLLIDNTLPNLNVQSEIYLNTPLKVNNLKPVDTYFIDLFTKNSNRYFPSYFVTPKPIASGSPVSKAYIIDHILYYQAIYGQAISIDYCNSTLKGLISDLGHIALEYGNNKSI